MSRGVEKALQLTVLKAKVYMWVTSFVRLIFVSLIVVLLFELKIALGLGAIIGLLSVVIALTTSLLIPFKRIQKEIVCGSK
jgi:hypothetical protein